MKYMDELDRYHPRIGEVLRHFEPLLFRTRLKQSILNI